MSASAAAARTSASSADLLAENAELKAQIAALTAKYERSAAQVAEQNGIVMALQARNDNLERAVRIADDSRNSLGVVLSYLDRVVPLNVDAPRPDLKSSGGRQHVLVKLARDAEEHERIAQQGPEHILSAPTPPGRHLRRRRDAAIRGEALVDHHPANRRPTAPTAPRASSAPRRSTSRPTSPSSARSCGRGPGPAQLIGKAYDALPVGKSPTAPLPWPVEANAALRSKGKPTKSAEGLVLAVDEDGELVVVDEVETPTTPQRAFAPAEGGEVGTEDEPGYRPGREEQPRPSAVRRPTRMRPRATRKC